MPYRRRYSYRKRSASRRRRSKIRMLYNPKGSSNSKVVQKFPSFGGGTFPNMRTRILYSNALTLIPHGDERNNREHNVVNVNGIRIQAQLANLEEIPILCNIAIVHPRSALSTLTEVTSTNFFRDYGSKRQDNFGTNLNSIQMSMNPINTDIYTVLYRKRFVLPNAKLSESGVAFDNQSKSSYTFWDKYIPIKRQLRFADSTTQNPDDGHLILVCWFDELLNPADTDASTGGVVRAQWRELLYFREGRR